MDNLAYINVNSLFWIVQAIPTSVVGDTVSVTIKRLSDGYTWNFSTLIFENAANSGSMTFVSDILWKQSFTPPTSDTYVVTVNDETLDTKFVQVLNAVGQAAPAGLTGSELTTLANVKTALSIVNTDDDAYLNSLIARVTDEAETYCRRKFADATYTEKYDGNGCQSMQLKQYPITSITSVHDDLDRAFLSDTLIDSDDYVFDAESGILTLDWSIFSRGVQNIQVVYNAGYTTMPQDLEQAAIMLVSSYYLAFKAAINATVGQDIGSKPYYLKKDAYVILDRYQRMI
ncbi:MAG TPA: phage head-tail connector protein [Candidatus Omnitrophota bacterium]|nr:phage head-tail connector protein [Candidatus Omnitrophota bacterium]